MENNKVEATSFDLLYSAFADVCNDFDDNGTIRYRLNTTLDLLNYIINYSKLLQLSAVNKVKGTATIITNMHITKIENVTIKINDKITKSIKSIIDVKNENRRTAIGLKNIQSAERYFYNNISKAILSYILLDRSNITIMAKMENNKLETIEWMKYIDMIEHMIIIFKKNLNFII